MAEASESSPSRKLSIYREMLRGSSWTVLMRWSVRLIGLVSIFIMARLLSPEDFGIVAIAVLVVSFLEIFASLGVHNHLIRVPEATDAHCNTAWTVSLLYGLVTGLILCGLAPLAARFFNEPRVELVIYIFAATSVLYGAENIGVALIRRELDFARDFRIVVYTRLIKFFVTVTFALLLRTYWAIVIGRVVGIGVAVLLSYLMHPYRPRLSLEKAREFLNFSLFVVPFNLGRFLGDKIGVLTIGRLMGTSTLGIFNLASELANMATQEITGPIERALYPVYAKITHDRAKLAEAYLYVFGAVAMICVPVGAGLASVADDMVPVVLGQKWLPVIPALQWMSIYTVVRALNRNLTGNIMIVSGHEKHSATAMWIELAILVPLVIGAALKFGLMGVVWAATASALAMIPVAVIFIVRVLPLSVVDLLGAVWRPVTAGLVMVATVRLVHAYGPEFGLLRLVLEVMTGALMYASTIVVAWRLSGSPAGFEHKLWNALSERLLKRSKLRPER